MSVFNGLVHCDSLFSLLVFVYFVSKIRVGVGVESVFVLDGDSDVIVIGSKTEGCRGEKLAVSLDLTTSADAVVGGDPSCAAAFDVNLAVLEPKSLDLGTLRSVEIALFECRCDRSVFKLIGFYHGEALEGVIAGVTEGLDVVIVIGSNAIDALARQKHRVISRGVVIVKACGDAASVDDLHRVHVLVESEIKRGFERPRGVVVGDEESGVASALHHVADAFGTVNALVIGLVFVEFYL